MFSASTVLGKKASEVEQSSEAGAELPGHRPPPYSTGGGPVNESVMFGELSILFRFFCFFFFQECAWVDGNGCVSECLYNAILVRRLWTVEIDV